MRYAVLGGDMRFAHLVGMLKESGRDACGFLQEKAGGEKLSLRELKSRDCIISNWPLRWPLSGAETSEEEIMENIAPGSVLLLCGPGFPGNRRWDLQYINIWQDEKLLRENAWLTAQGAVGSAMRRLGRSMADLSVMVIGCGRIGSALAEILLNQGAKVTVVSGSEEKRRKLAEHGAQAVAPEEMKGVLPGMKLIFSTPPSMVLDGQLLNYAGRDALIIDLASPPYGVDLKAAGKLGIQAVREPGLPGRWCPLSAARAIYSAVLRWEEAERNDEQL